MTKKTQHTEVGWNLDNSYASLPKTFHALLELNPVPSPKLVILNHPLAEALGLNPAALESEEGLAVLAGNSTAEGGVPLAQAYAGHQFGNFTMLGDGRALLHGEQLTPQGERFDIQLKGSGRTPFSRGGDGRAGLGPMLREYIMSEALYGLGIPTTRSLAVVTTGQQIRRESLQQGAVMTRIASSHIRVGTFQYAANRGSDEELRTLADYTLKRHFPHVAEDDERYLNLFREVIQAQAYLIAKWQLAGFIHGVMNTDNMALSGETIDYGPCAFMDSYDPKTVFSSIDAQGRYAYINQPMIGGWNLARFAESMLPLFHADQEKAVEIAQKELAGYIEEFQRHLLAGMRAKLGLLDEEDNDEALIEELLQLMHKHEADYTNTFRALTFEEFDDGELFQSEEFNQWLVKWRDRLGRQGKSDDAVQELMRSSNPAVIPRNHRVEEALQAAENGDYTVMHKLLDILKDPYAHSPEQAAYSAPPGPSNWPYQTYCGT